MSNQNLTYWSILKLFLGTKLGIEIPPAEVRMHPRKEDSYRWSILPAKQHLFKKNLSKLSTGVYTQIMQGIGVFLEALPRDPDVSQRVTNHLPDDQIASHLYSPSWIMY